MKNISTKKPSKELSLLYLEIDRCKGSKSYADYNRIKAMIPPCEPKQYQELIKLISRKLCV